MKSEEYRFYALVSRMRYITRWGLMRNTFSENVQEHSHMVAVLAHGLALIRRGHPRPSGRSGALRHGGAVPRCLRNSDRRPADAGEVL